jgi:hypothetical protein
MIKKSLLEGMKAAPIGESFYSRYFLTIDFDPQHQAGIDHLAVQEHAARATVAVVTTLFAAR